MTEKKEVKKVVSIREKILNADDIRQEIVSVNEWGVKLLVKGMTGSQRARMMSSAVDRKGNMDFEKMYAELVISGSYDPESGEKIFSSADKDALNEKSGGALEKIAKVCMNLSGLTDEEMDKIEKN